MYSHVELNRSAHLALVVCSLVLTHLFAGAARADLVSTLAGPLNASGDIAVDGEGNIYVADFGILLNNANGTQVLKVTPEGVVSVFATGLSGASGNEFDDDGNLFQSNIASGVISKILPDGTVTTFSTGHASPVGIAIDDAGNVYVSNCGAASIRRVTPAGVSTVFSSSGLFNCPNGLTIDADGNLYAANFGNGNVIKITPAGVPSIFATVPGGNNGHITTVGELMYVVARGGNAIWSLTLDGTLTRIAGTGVRGNDDGGCLDGSTFSLPNGIGASPDGKVLYTNSIQTVVGNLLNPILVRQIDLQDPATTEQLEVDEPDLTGELFGSPNPFVISTEISFRLAEPSRVRLQIVDASGRDVSTLVDEWRETGAQSVFWDGTDAAGQIVDAGVYWSVVETSVGRRAGKLIRLR